MHLIFVFCREIKLRFVFGQTAKRRVDGVGSQPVVASLEHRRVERRFFLSKHAQTDADV